MAIEEKLLAFDAMMNNPLLPFTERWAIAFADRETFGEWSRWKLDLSIAQHEQEQAQRRSDRARDQSCYEDY